MAAGKSQAALNNGCAGWRVRRTTRSRRDKANEGARWRVARKTAIHPHHTVERRGEMQALILQSGGDVLAPSFIGTTPRDECRCPGNAASKELHLPLQR